MSRAGHLVRRFFGALSNALPSESEIATARTVLSAAEFDLWSTMQGRDQRHSLRVLGLFASRCPNATKDERAAALLHDIGKTASNLGVVGRVTATVLGPVTPRQRLYLDHVEIGAGLLTETSSHRTIELVGERADDEVARALRDADDSQ